ncbi:four helix bundle protein [Psychroflexus halocasei]|uniref:Four helix bundle protein n=1 Tax=Psychroflexus halocasei TaxID=908615 RepID=A0A1H4DBN5_9FLAO|nr:four helix bundle protein [Psychroflexus halocasei]SEA69860.1 four helix bundle protein [Psychroflexus halocasei]
MDHKDLDVWKESMKLTSLAYNLANEMPDSERYVLKSQFLRSAISVPSNISEGAGRESDKELLRFLSISLGSLAELETQYLIAIDQKYIQKSITFEKQITNTRKLIFGFRNYIRRKND